MQLKLFITTAFFAALSGCTTPKSALDDVSKGQESIPASFHPSQGILLIEQSVGEDKSSVAVSTTTSFQTDTYMNYFMNRNKKGMMDFAEKNYKHEHAFASQEEIYGGGSRYSDKKKYQYALVTSLVKPAQYTKVNIQNGQAQSTHHQPIFRFYLYDRLNNITYSALGSGSSLIMWAYKSALKKLNAAP